MCTEKLVLDYHPKKEYLIHYLTLQCYMKMGGFKIENIHYIIKFKQSNYMKDYIEFNLKLRCETNNKIDEKIYKLISNSLAGRLLMNKKRLILIFLDILILIKEERQLLKILSMVII